MLSPGSEALRVAMCFVRWVLSPSPGSLSACELRVRSALESSRPRGSCAPSGLLQVGHGRLPFIPAAIPAQGLVCEGRGRPILTGREGQAAAHVETGGRNRAVVTSAGAERVCSRQAALPRVPTPCRAGGSGGDRRAPVLVPVTRSQKPSLGL